MDVCVRMPQILAGRSFAELGGDGRRLWVRREVGGGGSGGGETL